MDTYKTETPVKGRTIAVMNDEEAEHRMEKLCRMGVLGKFECPVTGKQKYIALQESMD